MRSLAVRPGAVECPPTTCVAIPSFKVARALLRIGFVILMSSWAFAQGGVISGSVKELAHGIYRYAEEFLARTPMKIRISMQPNLPEIAMEPSTRHSLFLATKEAISNVVKHSGAEQLHLCISFAGGVLEILVRDNGKGFDPSLPSHRNGLKGMNERLIQIGGACSITCSPFDGTTVEFRLPIA